MEKYYAEVYVPYNYMYGRQSAIYALLKKRSSKHKKAMNILFEYHLIHLAKNTRG